MNDELKDQLNAIHVAVSELQTQMDMDKANTTVLLGEVKVQLARLEMSHSSKLELILSILTKKTT